MSQWGASVAAAKGVDHRTILSTYYPTATLVTEPKPRTVRVLLESQTAATAVLRASATTRLAYRTRAGKAATVPTRPAKAKAPAACNGRKVTLTRVRVSTAGTAVDVRCGGSWRTWIPAKKLDRTAAVTVADSSGVVGMVAPTGARTGYRGTVSIRPSAGRTRVVVLAAMEDYLRSVVPSEIGSTWGAEALKAQAVAARTYAARSARDRAKLDFDVYDSTKSQAFPGVATYDSAWKPIRTFERAATDRAIAATAGQTLQAGGIPIRAEFTSSNGGVSASGGTPYLVAAADPWDAAASANPHATWTATLSAATLEARYPTLGRLTGIRVDALEGIGEWGGRLGAVTLIGSLTSIALATGEAVLTGLRLQSTYASFSGPSGPEPTTAPAGWVRPVPAGIADGTAFGVPGPLWASGAHTGLDLMAPAGTPVLAAAAGTVKSIGTTGPYGLHVQVSHPDGTLTLYAHLNAIMTRPGNAVVAGQQVGRSGATGNATGAHLHVEVRIAGTAVNPAPYVAAAPAVTPAAAAAPFDTRPTLAAGSRDAAVRTLQSALGVTPVSGYFGTATTAAVVAAQTAAGLPATGIVDPDTWTAIAARFAAAA